MRLDSLVNRGDYFSAHYLAEVLPKEIKRGLLTRWTEEEKDGRVTPRRGLRALGKPYFADRKYFADFDEQVRAEDMLSVDVPEWRKKLGELHGSILRALGYEAEPRELTVRRADEEHTVQVAYADDHLIAIECSWAADVDAALDGGVLYPVQLGTNEELTEPTKLASWLLNTDEPPRYVLILAGGVLVLADRASWGEGRYLGVSLDVALGRNDNAELEVIAALFGADSLLPPAEGGDEPLAELLTSSRNHAVGVSKDLRDGLKESVELIANEVLARIRAQGVDPEDIKDPRELADQLGRESLRYLYRILFLLYAEARPELGILPTNDQDYLKGYGLARLGDLVVRDLVGEQARNSFHLYESLDLLFRMVNKGYRSRTTRDDDGPDGEGLRFEPLRSDLFEPKAIKLIGSILLDDEDDSFVDTRLRNETLHKVLRRLMLTKGRRKERGGFISYAQLGINQLGAVYEGLMSYTGFIAREDLYEVAKNGDPKDGSWMIPASKADEYPQEVFVRRNDNDPHRLDDEFVRYEEGSFVYRLAGRDRETSASYYTPESLTQVTVQLALKHRLDQDDTVTTAREILNWKICEPALGSGAFLNEAINQVAAEYLKRRQKERGKDIDPDEYETELQRAKAYIALHNSYGVDLNDTAIELAEVSLWLNVMHPGLQAPWFGLHLRRGNSLIGAGRKVYDAAQLTKGTWLKEAPEEIPFRDGEIPTGKVHHFLLPADGWGAVAGAKEAKNLAPEQAKQLAAWRKKMKSKVSDKGRKTSQLRRLQALTQRAEYLWELVIQRLTISEREISRAINVWGADWIDQPENAVEKEKVYADLTAPGTPYWRLKTVMDAWCALWFWPLDRVALLDGTSEEYATASDELEAVSLITFDASEPEDAGLPKTYETDSLFSLGGEQLNLADAALTRTKVATAGGTKWKNNKGRKPTLDEVRRVIPLKDLDDWLDFAEAVLGRADVPEDSLAHRFSSLAELEEYENQLPIWTGMDDALSKLNQRFPWLSTAEDIAKAQGFFHWELHFAQTFNQGGFDLQVGNPPWVQPNWKEDAVLAEVEPWFKLADEPSALARQDKREVVLRANDCLKYYLREMSANSGIMEFLGSGILYPLLAGTKPDLYRAFMCRGWVNLHSFGIAAMIHLDTHFGGVKEGALRAAAYRHLRFHAHFSNRYELFEIEGTKQYGINIYGNPSEIGFVNASWLFSPVTLLASLDHDGKGDLPGIKHDGKWELRPHRGRLVWIDRALLSRWREFAGADVPVDRTPLLYPVTTAESGAIEALASYPVKLGSFSPFITVGLDESKSKKDGLIKWETGSVSRLDSVILQGPHIGQATPFNKRPKIPCKSNRDWSYWDLATLGSNVIPVTNYVPLDEVSFLASRPMWETSDGTARRYTEFFRLAWRARIPFDTERSLFAALLPPGPAHVNQVHTLALENNLGTVLAAGFWAALPIDYLLRISGRSDLHMSDAKKMPAAAHNHPLVSALLLRTLRLNCLTNAYADLWAELWSSGWSDETWVVDWPGLAPLNSSSVLTSEWNYDTPLRTERERRAALVELDAMVALWLGMTAEQLVAIYRSRYPVLSDYEAQTWFDANGRKIAGNHNTFGYGQTKEHFKQLQDHLDPEINGPVPDGYTAPFYKADREAEYRQAHAVFAERLRQSGWDGPIPSDEPGGAER